MNKLEVKTNKKLVLKQVLIKELKNISFEQIDAEITKFINELQLLKVQAFGPLITKSYGTNIHEDGTITTSYDIMVQAHDYKQYGNQFYTKELLQCEHCVHTRFQGKAEHMQFAYSKLDLYFYEHDLDTNGIVYNVFVSGETEKMVVDIFRPVVML